MESFASMSRKVFLDAVIDQIAMKVNFRTATELNTAFWNYDKNHNIVIGEGILRRLKKDCNPKKQIKSYLYHELGHAFFTEKDLVSVKSALSAKNIQFGLYNLFEDARIEELVRQKTNYNFKWLELEEHTFKKEEKSPEDILFEIVQNEGVFTPDDEVADRVYNYYYKSTLKAESSFHLIDIVEEFVKEFPEANQSSFKDNMSNENRFAGEFENSENKEEALRGCLITDIVINGQIIDEESDLKMLSEPAFGTKKTENFQEGKKASNVDYDFSKKSYRKLMPFFEAKTILAPTKRVSKKINTKGVIQDKDSVYKRKQIIGREKKKFNVIVDCSGSMRGKPIGHAATITHIFSLLAKENLVEGKLILSGSSKKEIYDIKNISDDLIEERVIANGGGEGFSDTFKMYQKELSKADINFVITDGRLTDGPLDKRAMTTQGIYTWGLYVGEHSDYGTLDQWFHRSNCVLDVGELIDKMAVNIKSL